MSDWTLSRAKSRIDRREELDELTARIRYEVRVHLHEPTSHNAYDELTDIFAIGHAECSALLKHSRVLPLWERLLLTRYTRRLYGKAISATVGDLPADAGPAPAAAFGPEIASLTPDSGDTGAKYDMQGRGLVNVFRIAAGRHGESWPDRHDVATTSARSVLTCSAVFLRRRAWHVAWPVYRVRGLRLWKL